MSLVGRVFLVGLAASGWTTPVAASVVIVRPAAPSPAAIELVSRLRGELLAVGLASEVAARPAPRAPDGASPRAWLESLTAGRAPDAALDIAGGDGSAAVDVWIFSREPRPDQVTRVAAAPDAEDAVGRLAIRAVEVLRAGLLERQLGVSETTSPPAAPPVLASESGAPPPGPSRRLGIEVGASVTSGLDGTAALAPVLRAGWSGGGALGLRLELSGLGTRPSFGVTGGSARVTRAYAVAGVCACGPSARRLAPILALSAGALHTTADGQADAPAQGHSVGQWSLLLQASVGARLTWRARYTLSLEAQVQVAEPYVAVYVGDAVAATLGRPAFALTLTLGGWR